jgi:ceramide glucosyltransferase
VRELIAANPSWDATLLSVGPDSGAVDSKIAKLQAALPRAAGEVLCFVDDDVSLPPDALQTLVRHLGVAGVGATFGLARYTAWETPWSSLMSLFVNAWALPSYVPLTFLAEPYTITGHCFAMGRDLFDAAGGLNGMEGRIDDDHELARRVRAQGLRCAQTPLVYDVENRLASARAYHAQLRRWFVLPRQAMLPQLTPRERAVTALGSIGNFFPPVAALVALLARRRAAAAGAIACLGMFFASEFYVNRNYLHGVTPWRRAPLLLVTALQTPLHMLAASLGDDVVEWRGQRIRVLRGGGFEVL